MTKLVTLLTKEKWKMVLKEWKNDDSDVLRDLYFVYEISTILLPYLLANLCNYTC